MFSGRLVIRFRHHGPVQIKVYPYHTNTHRFRGHVMHLLTPGRLIYNLYLSSMFSSLDLVCTNLPHFCVFGLSDMFTLQCSQFRLPCGTITSNNCNVSGALVVLNVITTTWIGSLGLFFTSGHVLHPTPYESRDPLPRNPKRITTMLPIKVPQ